MNVSIKPGYSANAPMLQSFRTESEEEKDEEDARIQREKEEDEKREQEEREQEAREQEERDREEEEENNDDTDYSDDSNDSNDSEEDGIDIDLGYGDGDETAGLVAPKLFQYPEIFYRGYATQDEIDAHRICHHTFS